MSATATDSTKKAAKHRACNLILKQVSEGVAGHTWSALDTFLSDWKFEDFECSHPHKVPGAANTAVPLPEEDSFNFVGALSEFSIKETAERVVGPEFKDLDVIQPNNPSERLFRVQCNLYLIANGDADRRHLLSIGSGTTKKSAKRKAAAAMVRMLQAEGKDVCVRPITYHKPGDDDSPVSQSAMPPVIQFQTMSVASDTTEWDNSETENQWTAQPNSDAAQQDDEWSQADSLEPDSFSQLQDLALNLKLEIRVDDVSSDSSVSFACMMTAAAADSESSDTKQVACSDSSSSFEAAKQSAASKLLKLLQHE